MMTRTGGMGLVKGAYKGAECDGNGDKPVVGLVRERLGSFGCGDSMLMVTGAALLHFACMFKGSMTVDFVD